MTQIKDSIFAEKEHNLKVLLIPEGRKLYFDKECLEGVTIHRKVNDGGWRILSKNTRAPYIDGEQFESPVVLAYKAVFDKQYQSENVVKVHLN